MAKRPRKPELGDQPIPTDRLLTPAQAARFLQVSPTTVKRQIRAGALPYVRVGNQIRFIPDDVNEFLRKKRTG